MTSADVSEEVNVDPRVDETTALLAAPGNPSTPAHGPEHVTSKDDEDEEGQDEDEEEDKPLPKDQIFFLCFARLVEPVAFFCIFPFINQMIWETGEVAETDVGFCSGLIVSNHRPSSSIPNLSKHHHQSWLTESCAAGILVFIDANAPHDPLGSSRRLLGEKTGPGAVAGWGGHRNRRLWPQQDDMANGRLSVFWWYIRWDYRVSLALVSHTITQISHLIALLTTKQTEQFGP
jgi:hypothetical protein